MNNIPNEHITAGGKDALNKKEQGEHIKQTSESSPSFGKFDSLQALLNAYNNLEAQFTKRSQELKSLERENESLKREQAELTRAESQTVQDETGSAAGERTNNCASLGKAQEGDIAAEVKVFLQNNPEAAEYAEELVSYAECLTPNAGFLDRAYVKLLKNALKREREKITDDFIYSSACAAPNVKEKIIRDYLSNLSSKTCAKLICADGESLITPPEKPKTLEEAGYMATSFLKRK